MQKTITWFKTFDDVKETLLYLEQNTDYLWLPNYKDLLPTDRSQIKEMYLSFDKYQSEWWFCLLLGNNRNLFYWSIKSATKDIVDFNIFIKKSTPPVYTIVDDTLDNPSINSVLPKYTPDDCIINWFGNISDLENLLKQFYLDTNLKWRTWAYTNVSILKTWINLVFDEYQDRKWFCLFIEKWELSYWSWDIIKTISRFNWLPTKHFTEFLKPQIEPMPYQQDMVIQLNSWLPENALLLPSEIYLPWWWPVLWKNISPPSVFNIIFDDWKYESRIELINNVKQPVFINEKLLSFFETKLDFINHCNEIVQAIALSINDSCPLVFSQDIHNWKSEMDFFFHTIWVEINTWLDASYNRTVVLNFTDEWKKFKKVKLSFDSKNPTIPFILDWIEIIILKELQWTLLNIFPNIWKQ